MMAYLKYVGGNRFLPTVPARDLTEDEVKKHGGEKFLLNLEPPLYIKVKTKGINKKGGE